MDLSTTFLYVYIALVVTFTATNPHCSCGNLWCYLSPYAIQCYPKQDLCEMDH